MIFQHTIDAVLSGRKTQTRRIVKPGDWFYFDGATIEGGQHRVYHGDDFPRPRLVYAVGHTYAAQPGRGKASVARIRLLNIRREDVRQISEADALAEGFKDRIDFLYTWVSMHDPKFYDDFEFAAQMNSIDLSDLKDRPAARYDAWALDFELVKTEAAR